MKVNSELECQNWNARAGISKVKYINWNIKTGIIGLEYSNWDIKNYTLQIKKKKIHNTKWKKPPENGDKME